MRQPNCLSLAFVTTAWIALAVATVPAQEELEKDASGLPTVRVILDKYVQALGGYEMLESRSSVHFVSNGYSTRGRKFVYEVYQVDGKFYSRFDFDDGHVIERGVRASSGRTRKGRRWGAAWESKDGVLREIEGDEREVYLRRRSTVSTATTLMTSYESIECHSVEFINDRKVYKLVFVDFEGTEIEHFYDAETGLLVRRACIEEFNNQRQRVVRDYHDYEKFGDFMVPKKQTVSLANGVRWVYEIELYEVDIKVPRGTFEMPKSVAASFAKANLGQQIEKERK